MQKKRRSEKEEEAVSVAVAATTAKMKCCERTAKIRGKSEFRSVVIR